MIIFYILFFLLSKSGSAEPLINHSGVKQHPKAKSDGLIGDSVCNVNITYEISQAERFKSSPVRLINLVFVQYSGGICQMADCN